MINVIGGQFLANEQMTLYWDQPSKVAGTASADANGNFNARVKPAASDAPGVHRLCANVPPNPCANFTLQAAVTSPSPSPTPTESPSPSPSSEPTPAQAATPARINATLSGFDVISKPPLVFLPIFGLGALILSLAYWAFSVIRRPRRLAPLPSAAVVHRATRPDYSAGFGTAPPRPADTPSASAWSESTPYAGAQPAATSAPPPPAPPAPEPQAPAVQWGLGTPDSGYPELKPPDRRPDGDWPEMPQPGD